MKCICSNKMNKQKGQAIVEHIVLWPLMVMLTLGTVQMSLLYRAKSTLNDATFRAAREGSVKNALKDPMRRKLAEAMAPLELKRNPGIGGYAIAVTKSVALNYTLGASNGGGRIDIVSPTQAIFNNFARDSIVLVPCPNRNANCPRDSQFGEARQRVRQIANDNLNVRRATTVRLNSGGQNIDINLQDANLLKIRSHWCYGLEVPFVNKVIYDVLTSIFRTPGPHTRACQRKTVVARAAGSTNIYYIPISSDSIVRMQSPVRCETNPRRPNYRNCANFRV